MKYKQWKQQKMLFKETLLWNVVLKTLHVYCHIDFLGTAQWKLCSVLVPAVCEAESSLVKEL